MEILRAIRGTSKVIKYYPDNIIDWSEIEETIPLEAGKCVNVAFAVKTQLVDRGFAPNSIKFKVFRSPTFFHVWLEIDEQVIDRPSIIKRVTKAPIKVYKYGKEDPGMDILWDLEYNEFLPLSQERPLDFYLSGTFDSA